MLTKQFGNMQIKGGKLICTINGKYQLQLLGPTVWANLETLSCRGFMREEFKQKLNDEVTFQHTSINDKGMRQIPLPIFS